MNKLFIPILIFLTIIFCLVFYNKNKEISELFISDILSSENNMLRIEISKMNYMK